MPAARPSQTPLAVVKIGSAVVAPGGRLSGVAVIRLAGEIAGVIRAGTRTVLVSSGAVACGLEPMGFARMPARINDRQAAAAAGQPRLMRAWGGAFAAHDLHVAQVLLTAEDIDFRARFVNAHRTLHTLLERGVVPIINENDSVSVDEIKLGDNDRLSALAAGLVGASRLVILSRAPGLCEGGEGGPVIPLVDDITAAREHVRTTTTGTGIGGMTTKLDAAATARAMGVETVIASGERDGVIAAALRGEPVGTRIPAAAEAPGPASRRKLWIAHSIRPRGSLVVDTGARRALVEAGASLLPKGVLAVETAGGFGIGAAVEIRTESAPAFARGLVSYRSDEIDRIKGRRSDEIEQVLGYAYCDEIIHRDDLILL